MTRSIALILVLIFICAGFWAILPNPSAVESSEDPKEPKSVSRTTETSFSPEQESKINAKLSELQEEDARAREQALKAFPKVKEDVVRNTRSLKPAKVTPRAVTSVRAEVVTDIKGNIQDVFVQWYCISSHWLNLDLATVASGDKRSTVRFDHPGHTALSGNVLELAVLSLSDTKKVSDGIYLPISIAQELASKDKVIVRFEGSNGYTDYELKSWEKDSILAGIVLARSVPTRATAIAALVADAPETR